MKFIWPLEIKGSYNQVLIRDDACSGQDKGHLLGTSFNIKKIFWSFLLLQTPAKKVRLLGMIIKFGDTRCNLPSL